MPAIVRVLNNTPHSDGTIHTELSVSVAGGFLADTPESRAKLKAKNRALLYNGYPKGFSRDDVGNQNISVTEIKETEDRFGSETFYVVTEIDGATEFHQG